MNHLSDDELLAIQIQVIHEFGGSLGVLDYEKLKSCLETPKQTMFGEDLYPDR